jgi:hypothetical protein
LQADRVAEFVNFIVNPNFYVAVDFPIGLPLLETAVALLRHINQVCEANAARK